MHAVAVAPELLAVEVRRELEENTTPSAAPRATSATRHSRAPRVCHVCAASAHVIVGRGCSMNIVVRKKKKKCA